MDYDYPREWWVRLYRRESNKDRAKPVLSRGLRDTLLRYAEPLGPDGKPRARSGELMRGKSAEHAVELLVNSMGAHPSERDQVVEYLLDWIDDGYLTVRKQKRWHILCITNYCAAQTARSKAAERMRRMRARKKQAKQKPGVGDVTRDATGDVTDAPPVRNASVSRGVRIRDRERDRERGSNIGPPDVTGDVTRYASDAVCDLAADYLADPVAVGGEHGQPHTWPPVVEVIAAGNAVYGRKHRPVNSGDRVVEVILERLSEGWSPSELIECVKGSAHDDFVQSQVKLQSLASLLRHPDRMEGFRKMFHDPPAAEGSSEQPDGDYDSGFSDKGSDVVKASTEPEAKAAAR